MKLSLYTNGVALQTMQTTQIPWSAQFTVLLGGPNPNFNNTTKTLAKSGSGEFRRTQVSTTSQSSSYLMRCLLQLHCCYKRNLIIRVPELHNVWQSFLLSSVSPLVTSAFSHLHRAQYCVLSLLPVFRYPHLSLMDCFQNGSGANATSVCPSSASARLFPRTLRGGVRPRSM